MVITYYKAFGTYESAKNYINFVIETMKIYEELEYSMNPGYGTRCIIFAIADYKYDEIMGVLFQ